MSKSALFWTSCAAALLASAATAAVIPHQVPRVCCRAVLPAKGDTVRLAVICADVYPRDSLGAVRITRAWALEKEGAR